MNAVFLNFTPESVQRIGQTFERLDQPVCDVAGVAGRDFGQGVCHRVTLNAELASTEIGYRVP
jgi:hypothetical protein